MLRREALERMVPPGKPRHLIWRGGIIQIWVTRACDRACPNCTQGSNLKAHPKEDMFISVDNFEIAVKSLEEYYGVVGIFGGNPVLHPEFETLCEILCKHIPKVQRGIWCNNPLGKGSLLRKVFHPKYSNLNVHGNAKAFDEFVNDWPESKPFGLQPSDHSPVHGSMLDVGMTEGERWKFISQCDINQRWSAMIAQFRGEPRAWFCEIAGSQSILWQHDPNYPDTGIYPKAGWWREGMDRFAHQVDHHCHNCLVPLIGKGSKDSDNQSQITKTYLPVYKPKTGEVKVLEDFHEVKPHSRSRATDYNIAITNPNDTTHR